MQVDWVRDGRVVVKDYAHGGVGTKVLDIPFRRKRQVARKGMQEYGLVVVAAELLVLVERNVSFGAEKWPLRWRRWILKVSRSLILDACAITHIHEKMRDVGCVLSHADIHVHSETWFWKLHLKERLRNDQVVVSTRLRVGHVPRDTVRVDGRVSTVVVECSKTVWLLSVRAGDVGADPECLPSLLRLLAVFRLDEDVGTLAHAERHHLGVVRFDGRKVVRDDGHCVLVDGETLRGLGARVYEAQPVRLAWCEEELRNACVGVAADGWIDRVGAVEVGLAVDQVVIRERGAPVRRCYLLNNVVVLHVIPVAEHDGSEVDVVACVPRPVDDDWTEETPRVLGSG